MNKVNNKSAKAAPVMLIIGILFIAANLRAPLTSVGPLVSLIRDNLHISNTLAGTITSLPLFAFALFSPLIPGMARKFGTEVCFFGSVIILTLGILLRSYAGSFSLFLGTAIIGLAISASNVLMPSLIKKEFPNQVGVMTGLYSVSMSIFAALASGISIPLAVNSGLGWAGALKIWAVLSFISIIIWIPQLRKNSKMAVDNMAADTLEEVNKTNNIDEPTMKEVSIWKSSLAWQVTIYMGLQSMIFYCIVTWLPSILIQQGMTSSQAGWMLSIMQLALIPTIFFCSILAGHTSSQHSLVMVGSLCIIIGFLGLLLVHGFKSTILWIILLGIGGGFTFSLSMMFFNLRTNNANEAARLSGMAQSIGYLLAAFGPMFFGYLHDATNN
ncbi:CynX/NimT family MFS transporter, partial [Phascolarctobacterium faecium]